MRNPIVVGTIAIFPIPSFSSMLGINNDHTLAATITPDEKPNNSFCSRVGISFRMKNTKADPNMVPKNGMRRMIMNS